MSVQPKTPKSKPRMTVDEFFAWADGREGKYELVDGEVVAMSAERVRHVEVKFAVCAAMKAAIREEKLPCRAFIDGLAVRVGERTSYVPDVLVHCGGPIHPDAMEVPEPVIVVEVVSPSSTSIDTNRKLTGYFRIPSVMHYLVVDPDGPMVIHHRRGPDGIEARLAASGTLQFSPPGLTVEIADFFAED